MPLPRRTCSHFDPSGSTFPGVRAWDLMVATAGKLRQQLQPKLVKTREEKPQVLGRLAIGAVELTVEKYG